MVFVKVDGFQWVFGWKNKMFKYKSTCSFHANHTIIYKLCDKD